MTISTSMRMKTQGILSTGTTGSLAGVSKPTTPPSPTASRGSSPGSPTSSEGKSPLESDSKLDLMRSSHAQTR